MRKGERGDPHLGALPAVEEAAARVARRPARTPTTEPRPSFASSRSSTAPRSSRCPSSPAARSQLDPPIEPIERRRASPTSSSRWRSFGASLGFAVAVEEIPGDAQRLLRRRRAKRIAVEAISAEFSANAQVATEIHELAHALVRCERREEDPKLTYAEEEVVVECVAYTVCSTLGLDTAGFSVPYLASWGEGGEIERYAALIDRLARRLEDAALAAGAPADGEARRLSRSCGGRAAAIAEPARRRAGWSIELSRWTD